MERLSVDTAIIGILAVAARLSESLWDLDAAPGDESALLDLAVQEVKQCRSSIKLLHKTLVLAESAQLPYPARAAWVRVDHLVAILTDIALALHDFQVACEVLMQGSDQSQIQPSVRQQCVNHIRALCSRLRWHNLSIAMLMTALKCKADSDAEASSKGLDQRMTRLLSSNAGLSSRMALLQDAFGAKPPATSPPPNPYHSGPNADANAEITPAPTATDLAAPDYDSLGVASRPSSPRSWSTFSGYTLADLSSPLAVALPLTTYDLRDGTLFYTAAYARQASQDSGDSARSQPGFKSPTTAESISVSGGGGSVPVRSVKVHDWHSFASRMKRLGRRRRDKKQEA
jgi:hypothetical protein